MTHRHHATSLLLLILLHSLCSGSAAGPYEYDSSYVYATVQSDSLPEKTYCVNYQQWQKTSIAKDKESATPLRIGWWRTTAASKSYVACGLPVSGLDLSAHIVPLDYRIAPNNSKCPSFPSPDGWKNQSTFQINRVESVNGAAIMFLLNRGQKYLNGFRDFLASADSSTTVRFHRPVGLPFDLAMLIIFLIAEFCVVVGGFASGRRRLALWLDEMVRADRRQKKIDKLNQQLASNNTESGSSERESDQTRGAHTEKVFSSASEASAETVNVQLDTAQHENVPSTMQSAHVHQSPNHNAQAHSAINQSSPSTQESPTEHSSLKSKEKEHEPSAVPFTWVTGIVMVVFIVGMLLLAYFYRPVLVWVFIVVFMLGAANAMYTCITSLLAPCPCCQCTVCMSVNDVTKSMFRREFFARWEVCSRMPRVIVVLAVLVSVATPIIWCIYRNALYGFVLQDLLSTCFCIHFMKTLRMPSLMSISILLCVMLVYDLFMVFITPFITPDGCSIMVQVATGMACQPSGQDPDSLQPVPPIDAILPESIPILFRVPRLSDPMLGCYDLSVELQYKPMILGMGDVILPGLLVAFCFGVDCVRRVPFYVYGVSCCIAYAIGLLLTFGALLFMNSAQPALIYLVPCTLLATFLVALVRKEFMLLWRGLLVGDLFELVAYCIWLTDEGILPAANVSEQSAAEGGAEDMEPVTNGSYQNTATHTNQLH